MKSVTFKEANCKIAETQDEFQTIHSEKKIIGGFLQHTMCFELDVEEMKQVGRTGKIWLKRYLLDGDGFQPIGMDVLKPKDFE